MCPPSQTIFTCGTNAVGYYKKKATTGWPDPCTSPSGTTFPLARMFICRPRTSVAVVKCSSGHCEIASARPPALAITAGNDNFVLPVDLHRRAPAIAAFSGFPSWKDFDQVASGADIRLSFTGCPITS
jgi:hypothetical protein